MTEKPETNITEAVNAFLAEQRAASRANSGGMSFTKSVQAFIEASDWIGPEHMPAVYSLVALAEKLDEQLTAALASQFGVAFRDLRSQAPRGIDADDPLEQALRERS